MPTADHMSSYNPTRHLSTLAYSSVRMSGKDDLDKLRNTLAFHIPEQGTGKVAVTKDDYPKFIAA